MTSTTNKKLFYIKMILGVIFVTKASTSGADIGVFFPTFKNTKSIEKAIKDDKATSGNKTFAFAKFTEFNSKVNEGSFDIVIAPSSFPSINKSCKSPLQITKKGKSSFRYKLIAVDKKWNKGNIATGSVGIVDELGRRAMKKYVKDITSIKFKKIKRVTKPEDLFPLMSLGNADFVLIRPENLAESKQQFKIDTFEIMESKPVNYPIICELKKNPKNSVGNLKKLSAETLKTMGFSAVRDL